LVSYVKDNPDDVKLLSLTERANSLIIGKYIGNYKKNYRRKNQGVK